MTDLATLSHAREGARERLHSLPNVHSIGLGFKEVGGRVTDQLCMRVYVTPKLPLSELGETDRVPDQIGGVATDVIERYPELDQLTAPPSLSTENTFKTRPVACGVQITRATFLAFTQYIGTTTCFVNQRGESANFLLTAAHVLDPTLKNKDHQPHDDVVYQPMSLDKIGMKGRKLVLRGGVDAGIAQLDDDISVRNPQYVWKLGNLTGIADVSVTSPRVGKHGRTTGVTYGTVVDFSYGKFGPYPNGTILSDQLVIKGDQNANFADEGDSGSPVVIPGNESCTLVGLLVGTTQIPNGPKQGVANKIKNVFRELAVSGMPGNIIVVDWPT